MSSGCPELATASVLCPHHRQRNCERLKNYEQRRKLEAFRRYGGARCACCGEDRVEFLAIDHIHGDGNRHRRECKIGKMYAWLKRNGYPPGFQVLCFNCNQAKSAGGECPHQKERDYFPEYCI
jgi:hypothetical protein